MEIKESKKAKPDYLDMDKDGDKKEPMKKAVKDKEVDEAFDSDAKVGDTYKTSKGVVTKTKTGLVHKSTGAYGGSEEKPDDEDDEKPAKKAKKK